jgi:hypothetical protein
MPTLTIVVVTYQSRLDIDTCLTAIREAPPALDHRIVVVDNASADGTAAHVRGRWPAVIVMEAGANVGFAAANNIGIRQTDGELVLLLNPDTRVLPGAIDRLAAALAARADAAVAGPRLVDATGRAELSFGRMLTPLNEIRQKLLVTGHSRGVRPIARHVERMTRRNQAVDWVSGACLLIRRRDLEAAGCLDERFFMYTEDVDLCATVRAAGRRVLFVPDAVVQHLRGRSRGSAPRATHAAYRRSQVAFYEKHHPRWVPMLRAYLKARGEWPASG